MSSSYRRSLEAWLKDLDVTAKVVFDIGGSQLPVNNRVKSWKVGKSYIIDMESPHKESPAPDFPADLNLPFDLTIKADLIFCLEVFEYIYDPFTALVNIRDLLVNHGVVKGRAYISFPFAYPVHEPREDDSLRYTEYGIKKLCDAVGLTIINMISRRSDTDALAQAYAIERMRPAKGYDHSIIGWIVEVRVP
ncbi:hypothetical protein UFOVP585_24 [uncultured Caudovirales phage]|uniref:Uncharacterized protein n=1 Tax=uncultured Caudovirales phage TaxID=2100421 RepID=A0A6J5MYP0_9CAUD|nr:hypothetical protein UFOVP585_24 [uncultured Caudovirales phage]